MAEMMHALEMLAYLANGANSVRDRRQLDELMKETDTVVNGTRRWSKPTAEQLSEVAVPAKA